MTLPHHSHAHAQSTLHITKAQILRLEWGRTAPASCMLAAVTAYLPCAAHM